MYQVRWEGAAIEELTQIWTEADSSVRQAVTDAVSTLDQELQHNAPTVGESRSEGRRICFVPPLAAVFNVDDPNKLASVLHVWTIQRRSDH